MKYKNGIPKRILAFCMVLLLCLGAPPTTMAADAPCAVSGGGDVTIQTVIYPPIVPEEMQPLAILLLPLLVLIYAVLQVKSGIQTIFERIFGRG